LLGLLWFFLVIYLYTQPGKETHARHLQARKLNLSGGTDGKAAFKTFCFLTVMPSQMLVEVIYQRVIEVEARHFEQLVRLHPRTLNVSVF